MGVMKKSRRNTTDWGGILIGIFGSTLVAAGLLSVGFSVANHMGQADRGEVKRAHAAQSAAVQSVGHYLSSAELVAKGVVTSTAFSAVTDAEGSCYIAAVLSPNGAETWLLSSRSIDTVAVADVTPGFYDWCVPNIDALLSPQKSG